MNTDEVIQKSISGAKWTVLLSMLAIPLGFITNIILGRFSPEALGIYGLFNIFIGSITTFILFGGNNVVVKYLPEIEREKQISFLTSYIIIIFFISIFAIAFIYYYPPILSIIFGQKFPIELINYLILFIPIIILYSVFDFALNGLMEIKASVIIGKITVIGYFIAFSILSIFFESFFKENLWAVIWGLSFILYTIMGVSVLFQTLKVIRIKNLNSKEIDFENVSAIPSLIKYKIRNFNLYLPKHFWTFTIITHLSTILVFAYDRFDQLFILKYFSIAELGIYYAVLQTSTLIRLIPTLLGNILLPTFSNLLVSNDIRMVNKGYNEVSKYNNLVTVPVSLFFIFFSRQIMELFGEAYVQNYLLMVILSICFMISSMGGLYSSLIVVKGKVGVYLLNSTIQLIFQFLIMLFLVDKIGILGLAIGRGLGVVLAQVGLFIIIDKLSVINIIIGKEYKATILTSIITLLIYALVQPKNLIASTTSFLLCTFLFLNLGGYSLKDIYIILKHLRNKRYEHQPGF